MLDRNKYIDYIKGITIILVIIPHCIQYGSGSTYLNECFFYDNVLFKFIYSFHMPVFMMISGYLFKYSISRHSFGAIIKSRITNLLIPILVWNSIYVIIQNYLISDETLNVFYWESYIKNLWFLWAVLWNSLLILLVHNFYHDSIIIYIILFVILLFIPHRYNSNYYVFMYPYFLIGYIINNSTYSIISIIKDKLSTHFATIIISIIFLLLLSMYSREDYVYTSKTNVLLERHISFHMIFIDIYRWSIGFIGSFLFWRITQFLYRHFMTNSITTSLINIGTKTMGIYIISDYAFRFFYLLPIKSLNYLYISIEVLCILALSYFITKAIGKEQHLRIVLLGGR